MDSPPPPQPNWRDLAIENPRRPGWLAGELLERAILRTLARHAHPLTWRQIVELGPLDHCSTSVDRNSAIASLVASGRVIVESVTDPHELWSRIDIYSLAASATPPERR